MKLIGSNASPYVRRLRILLNNRDIEFEFITVNVFEDSGRKVLEQYGPLNRIPILVDGENTIWDSYLITEYLFKEEIPLEVKKQLFLINEMTDSGIQLYQLRKFETDPNDSGTFSKNNLLRIQNTLKFFELNIPTSELLAVWLYCTLEWFNFRNVVSWENDYQSLKSWFYEMQSNDCNNVLKETSPFNH